MPLTLILMRHAKSSWGDLTLDDFDRPLNGRGRGDAPKIGQWLADQGLTPTEALCSPAIRARETLDLLALQTPVTYVPGLYMAAPAILLGAIQAATGARLLVIAHNPGMAMLAGDLVKMPPDHPKFHDYPTAATLALDFDIDDWSALRPGTGHLRGFVTPRDLP